jgi:cell division transport system ATP-binding protein
MIQFFSVTKRYPGGQTALADLSFDIPRGQFTFLTGPSGAGKTTLLKLIFREEVPSEGQIVVNGRNVSSIPRSKIPYLRRTLGVVFQDFRLIPRKTVFENVTYLPRILGRDAKTQKRLAYQALRRVGLAHRMNAFPLELSGGEQQRVALARALINEPEILIADEPTGNLDPELSVEILRLLLEINLRGTTLLIATHDRETIRRVGRRVLTLEAGRLVDDQMLDGEEPPQLGSRPLFDSDDEEENGLGFDGDRPERPRDELSELNAEPRAAAATTQNGERSAEAVPGPASAAGDALSGFAALPPGTGGAG